MRLFLAGRSARFYAFFRAASRSLFSAVLRFPKLSIKGLAWIIMPLKKREIRRRFAEARAGVSSPRKISSYLPKTDFRSLICARLKTNNAEFKYCAPSFAGGDFITLCLTHLAKTSLPTARSQLSQTPLAAICNAAHALRFCGRLNPANPQAQPSWRMEVQARMGGIKRAEARTGMRKVCRRFRLLFPAFVGIDFAENVWGVADV